MKTKTPISDATWDAFCQSGAPPQHLRDNMRALEDQLTAYKEAWRVDKQKMMDAQIERDDWLRCAEKLASAVSNANAYSVDMRFGRDALTEFEKLKAARRDALPQ